MNESVQWFLELVPIKRFLNPSPWILRSIYAGWLIRVPLTLRKGVQLRQLTCFYSSVKAVVVGAAAWLVGWCGRRSSPSSDEQKFISLYFGWEKNQYVFCTHYTRMHSMNVVEWDEPRLLLLLLLSRAQNWSRGRGYIFNNSIKIYALID